MRTWKDVAALVKTKNLKGRFVARPAAGLPFLLEEGMRVAFVPPQTDLPREATVCFVNDLANGSFEIGFDEVADEEAAHGLVGCHCLVRRSDIEELPLFEEIPAWSGWTVSDEEGETLGAVLGMVDNPAHPLLELELADGAGSVLVPLVEEFIVRIDENRRVVAMDLPKGLLEL